MTEMILIMASTFGHANDEARRRSLPPARWRWISKPEDIRGLDSCNIIQMHPILAYHDDYMQLLREIDVISVTHKIEIEHVWT